MYIRRPFKGNTFYEWQIGPFVFQIKHRPNENFRRIHVWRDPYWNR